MTTESWPDGHLWVMRCSSMIRLRLGTHACMRVCTHAYTHREGSYSECPEAKERYRFQPPLAGTNIQHEVSGE